MDQASGAHQIGTQPQLGGSEHAAERSSEEKLSSIAFESASFLMLEPLDGFRSVMALDQLSYLCPCTHWTRH